MKVSQLFGLFIFREASGEFGFREEITDEDGNVEGYDIDLGRGPVVAELDPGDRAEFLESKSPAVEYQQFLQTIIQVCLKALDIPYSFYAENFTNYSGQRQAFLQYERSAEIKRGDIRQMLDDITRWWVMLWWLDGEFQELISAHGLTIDAIEWEWVPMGLPWLDPLKEIQADITAIDRGLDNPEDVAQRHGRNFYQNIDKIAACMAYAESKGVKLAAGAGGTVTAPEAQPADPAAAQDGSTQDAPPSGDQQKDTQGRPVNE